MGFANIIYKDQTRQMDKKDWTLFGQCMLIFVPIFQICKQNNGIH